MEQMLAEARYSKLMWNAPLSDGHADELIEHMQLRSDSSLVDLGCGWGELLLRIASRTPMAGPISGVDTDTVALCRGRQAADKLGIDVSFIEQKSEAWSETRSHAICIGSSHTLGGSRAMLTRLAEIVPQGRALIGDMCWERPPTEAAHAMFGDNVCLLADLVAMCRETGWAVMHLSTADQREWDDFESRHRAGLREWALRNPNDPQVSEIRKQQDARERNYITTYRGVLGFAFLVLAR